MRAETNVLVLCATPEDQIWIRPDKEGAVLEEGLAMVKSPARPLKVVQKYAVRPDQVQLELLNNRPHILHFSGHGCRGHLAFETREGVTARLSSDVMGSIVEAYGKLECIVLHACFTEEVAKACARHVDTVIGSTGEINDETAPAFTFAFYQAVAHGRPYANAFRMGLNEVATIDPNLTRFYKIIE